MLSAIVCTKLSQEFNTKQTSQLRCTPLNQPTHCLLIPSSNTTLYKDVFEKRSTQLGAASIDFYCFVLANMHNFVALVMNYEQLVKMVQSESMRSPFAMLTVWIIWISRLPLFLCQYPKSPLEGIPFYFDFPSNSFCHRISPPNTTFQYRDDIRCSTILTSAKHERSLSSPRRTFRSNTTIHS